MKQRNNTKKRTVGKKDSKTDKASKMKAKKAQEGDQAKKTHVKHRATLEKLKDQDPEFYKFLQNEDQELLAFSGSDSDFSESSEESSSDEEERNNVEKTGKTPARKDKKKKKQNLADDLDLDEDSDSDDGIHRPPAKLEVASDSDDEDDDDEEEEPQEKGTGKGLRDHRIPVTMKMINQWSAELRESSVKALREAAQAFRAAVQQAGSDAVHKSPFKVEGATVFNGVVRMCIKEIPPMLNKHLQMPKKKDRNKVLLPSNSGQWNSVKRVIVAYLRDIIELLSQMSEAAVLNVVLKHVSQMVPCFACFGKLARGILKKLIRIWSAGEESSRVLAFLSINRLTRLKQDMLVEFTLKQMYLAYVTNSKFTSPTTLPLINFMQHSLIEMFAIDQDVTYQYAFMYIRQLAIHLRNALTVKKKDTCQSVYNWQYIHSLELWSRALSQLHPSETLEPLIYPLVQTTIGTIKLIPSAKYYPLRFHCVRALNRITASTKTFVPVLPFLVEVFDLTDFNNKKNKSSSLKPYNFACILKLSKAQLREKSFRDGVIDQLYEHLMEAFHAHAHTVGFPELVLPPLMQMKKFLKTCKVPNYTKQIRQIVEKVEETSRVITQRRKTAALRLADTKAVDHWEKKSKEEGTPLGKFYTSWRKLRDRELQYEAAGKDQISTDDIPVIERRPKERKSATEQERIEFSKIFDGSDDSDDETRFLLKEERPNKKQKTDDDSDDYSDFDEKELEILARSASEEEDDEDEGSIELESEDEDEGDDIEDHDDDDDSDDDDNDIDNISDEGDIVEDFKFSDDDDDDSA